MEAHGELFRPAWWREILARLRAGKIIELVPYDRGRRLHGDRALG